MEPYKQFSDYCRGIECGTGGLRQIARENRDAVQVSWMVFPTQNTRKIELQWHDEAKGAARKCPVGALLNGHHIDGRQAARRDHVAPCGNAGRGSGLPAEG